ncbi:ECF transporter S component [Radiobacillus deserti]|uniref:ECF transporter S component n=1 Tax=Radiobacillus deserti TaxID=2594883 RepID=A0A516KGH4_9BACI|nr:ECF transporter S component [Radiobacillus deserti]QDP40500.1 ECF transporter S component [Radiobacillus deserti]
MNTYRITVISILAALAVVGRFAFQFLPNVQPVTTIIIICGLFLGPVSAIILAILTTYMSNLLLGMGIWTIWQVIIWGFIGLCSGWLGKWKRNLPFGLLVAYAVLIGYLYGFVISLATYTVAGSFWPYYFSGLLFDTYHAVGNAFFMIVLYPVLSKILEKYYGNYLKSNTL